MLKFADLSVDMKSYENSLNSYMKLFPNSYMPLLIMTLAKKGLLTFKEDDTVNDSHVLIQISKQEAMDFVGDELRKGKANSSDIINYSIDELKKSFGEGNDMYVLMPLLSFINMKSDRIYMIIDDSASEDIIKVKDIIMSHEPEHKNNAALWYFYVMIFMKTILDYPQGNEDDLDKCKWFSYFDEILVKLQTYAGDKTWMQPEALTEIILSMKEDGDLYNPFAGLASYQTRNIITFDGDVLYSLNVGDGYFGQEIDELTWAIGKLRLIAYDTDSRNYKLSDSTLWIDRSFPNVISTPPFGLKIQNEKKEKEYADHFVVRRSVDTMSDDGMAAIVVPASFLTRKDSYTLRKRIIDEHLLEVVVILPEGIFSNTNLKTAIIFLSKRDNNTVKFVDASKYFFTEGRIRKLAKKAIINLLLNNEFPEDEYTYDERKIEALKNEFNASFNICRLDEIIDSDYTLSVNKYIHQLKSSDELEVDYLGNIFFPVTKDREEVINSTFDDNPSKTGRYVETEDLSTNPLTPYLDYLSLKHIYYNDTLVAVKGPAILFALEGELRPTLLRKGETVLIDQSMISPFSYDSDIFYGEYIVNELYKPRVKEQLVEMELENERTSEDIEIISILCPKFDPYDPTDWNHKRLYAQKDAINKEKSRRILYLEQQLADLKDKGNDAYIKSLRQRKHRIQQVMNELCPAFDLLNKRRLENGALYNDDIVGKRTGKTVSDYFTIISDAIGKVEDMITHIVDEDEWGESVTYKLKEILREIAEHNLSDRYSVKVNYHVNDGYGEDAILVSVNKDKFAIVFENIFANAFKWGFIDTLRNDYCIKIDVDKPSLNTVRIRVSNNGEPINPSLDRSRIFEWGIGNHTGYGTWQVKNIVEHYLGTVELHEYPDDVAGFQTEYEIVLPAYL